MFHKATDCTFQPNQVSLPITVQLKNDDLPELTEEFFVVLGKPTNATLTGGDDIGKGIIVDDDAPSLRVDQPVFYVVEGNGGMQEVPLTISLNKPSPIHVTVVASLVGGTAQPGTDFVANSQVLTFLPGETVKPFFVRILGDTAIESHESLSVQLSRPVNAEIGLAHSFGFILNDETSVSIRALPVDVAENNANAVVRVQLAAPNANPVQVRVNTTDRVARAGLDYIAVDQLVTFYPGQISHDVSIPLINDANRERNEAFAVEISSPIHASIHQSTAVINIVDDETGPIILASQTIRDANGAWRAFSDQEDAAGDRGSFRSLSTSAVNGEIHSVGVSEDGRLWHSLRRADGSVTQFADVEWVAGDRGFIVEAGIAATPNGDLHASRGQQCRPTLGYVRRADGSWLHFADVEGEAGDRGHIKQVSLSAAPNGDVHVLAVNTEGRLWHAIRYPYYWTPFGDVEGEAGDRGNIIQASIAVDRNGDAHVLAVNSEGRLWHSIRTPWYWTQFGDVEGEAGDRGLIAHASLVAAPNGEVHVLAVNTEGRLWHSIRYPYYWTGFADVEGESGERGRFLSTSATFVNDQLLVTGLSQA